MRSYREDDRTPWRTVHQSRLYAERNSLLQHAQSSNPALRRSLGCKRSGPKGLGNGLVTRDKMDRHGGEKRAWWTAPLALLGRCSRNCRRAGDSRGDDQHLTLPQPRHGLRTRHVLNAAKLRWGAMLRRGQTLFSVYREASLGSDPVFGFGFRVEAGNWDLPMGNRWVEERETN